MNHLYRSRDDRMLAGVAGGLAELWDADPSLVRIIWALLVIPTGGIALVVYIVMALVVPEEPDVAPPAATMTGAPLGSESGSPAVGGAFTAAAPSGGATPPSPPPTDWRAQRAFAREGRRAARAARRAEHGTDGRTASIVIGGVLILVGLVFLVREYLPSIDLDYVWPVALVALGIVVVLTALRSNGPAGPRSGGPS